MDEINALEVVMRYAWHDPNTETYCVRWDDRVPTTRKGWERTPKRCTCGFYQALHALIEQEKFGD